MLKSYSTLSVTLVITGSNDIGPEAATEGVL